VFTDTQSNQSSIQYISSCTHSIYAPASTFGNSRSLKIHVPSTIPLPFQPLGAHPKRAGKAMQKAKHTFYFHFHFNSKHSVLSIYGFIFFFHFIFFPSIFLKQHCKQRGHQGHTNSLCHRTSRFQRGRGRVIDRGACHIRDTCSIIPTINHKHPSKQIIRGRNQ